MNKTEKAHKYNVGDTFTVKIAETFKVNEKRMYRLEGMGIPVSEKVLEKMRQDKFIPGDTAYVIYLSEEEKAVAVDVFVVTDVATKEIKLEDDWFVISEDDIFKNQDKAERRAVELAVKYGYLIRKGGLLKQEADNGNE